MPVAILLAGASSCLVSRLGENGKVPSRLGNRHKRDRADQLNNFFSATLTEFWNLFQRKNKVMQCNEGLKSAAGSSHAGPAIVGLVTDGVFLPISNNAKGLYKASAAF